MSTLSDNLEAFRNGIKMFKESFEQQAIDKMYKCAGYIILYAIAKKTWSGFTGNAQTSFTIGIYKNGSLLQYVNGEMVEGRKALMKKIKYGKKIYLKNPFEGPSRAVKGDIQVADEYATDTAINFLKSFKASPKGLSMVVTIGVEYYMFLDYNGINALTRAYNKTTPLLNRVVFKQIKI